MSRKFTNHEIRFHQKEKIQALEMTRQLESEQLSNTEREIIAEQIEAKYGIRKYKAYDSAVYTIMPEETFKAVLSSAFRQLEVKKILAVTENLPFQARALIEYLIEPTLKLDYYELIDTPCVYDLKEP